MERGEDGSMKPLTICEQADRLGHRLELLLSLMAERIAHRDQDSEQERTESPVDGAADQGGADYAAASEARPEGHGSFR